MKVPDNWLIVVNSSKNHYKEILNLPFSIDINNNSIIDLHRDFLADLSRFMAPNLRVFTEWTSVGCILSSNNFRLKISPLAVGDYTSQSTGRVLELKPRIRTVSLCVRYIVNDLYLRSVRCVHMRT